MFLRYPENYDTIMPLECTESGGGICLIFPNQKRILSLYDTPTTTDTILLSGMNNGIYLQPYSEFFDVVAITSLN